MSHSPTRPRQTQRLAAGPDAIAHAARVLRAGGLAAFPTETVYGLGAIATSDDAVAGIYAAKERPSFNPLIAHVPDLAAAQAQGAFGPDALALARAFWPGPLTLVVPASAACGVSLLARAGLDTLALRVPAHPVARALLEATGLPVAAPSANRSGRVSPTTAEHVARDLDGRVDLILDGGPCAVGVESTIVACLDGAVRILRPGGVTRAQFE
ncbi:MAG: threonylcarbamoyl-AMP synthase, partial [Hyphomicrobiales bacterium]|nr:threonylcarbamoyl-AMP synthase [Hyphomicrobiales bacterium]